MRRLRRPILSVVIFFLSLGTATFAAERVIPRGAKICITEMPEYLDFYLKAEIVKKKKKVPVRLVNSEEEAKYILRYGALQREMRIENGMRVG